MKDDYMCSGQLNPGYNLQIATKNQYVLADDLFQNSTDIKNLNPFLDNYLEQHNELLEYIVADAVYGSEENYMYINDILHKTPLITYASYHKEIKRPIETVPLWLITGAILRKKMCIFVLPIGQFPSSDIVEEKIKVDLYVSSKFTNVKIVEAALFVVNVRKQKVSEPDKF